LYSGHDYTLLALLSALRVPAYPEMGIAFGAFLLFELRKRMVGGSPQFTVDVFLNPEPFPLAHPAVSVTPCAASKPESFSNQHCRSVVKDLPLESLQYMVMASEQEPRSKDGRYGATATMPNSLAGTEHARAAASI
jgi:hypothetical protein